MASEDARARARRRGPGKWGFLLAHHWSEQLDRCYLIWLGTHPVWLCARCTGVYPVLFLVLAAQIIHPLALSNWDLLFLFVLPWPALIDWALARLTRRPGSNRWRTITGVVLGISLGRMIYLHLVNPFQTLVILQLLLLSGIVGTVELLAIILARQQKGAQIRGRTE